MSAGESCVLSFLQEESAHLRGAALLERKGPALGKIAVAAKHAFGAFRDTGSQLLGPREIWGVS